ncbi:hypothetical protein E2C01_055039 [Portunus trituberculatus]|uniref:Uncharacterized protein n=1 Tax=Portunus trituberculatus TaxID=210409 RepID=A0A5B7GUV5_PORTR|nr:hypothetical protein [Portunus trituberculatus]
MPRGLPPPANNYLDMPRPPPNWFARDGLYCDNDQATITPTTPTTTTTTNNNNNKDNNNSKQQRAKRSQGRGERMGERG